MRIHRYAAFFPALLLLCVSCVSERQGNSVLLRDDAVSRGGVEQGKDYVDLMRRGAFYENAGDLTNALSFYKSASELRPNEPEPYFGMGNAYLKGGMYEKAEKQFLKAVELEPNVGVYRNNLAWTYIEMGLPVTAREHALKGSYLDFQRKYIYSDTLGVIEMMLGNFKGAENHFRDAAMFVPATDLGAQYKIYSHIRDLFVKTGDKNKATKAEEKLNNIRIGVFPIYDF